jgi:XTP/dITP diphosphohydrolase
MNETVFLRLLQIVKELRVKCPWDKEQSIESLRHLTIEEAFELSGAILDKNYTDIEVELGDVLLHIVFYAVLGEEIGKFDMNSVIDKLCDKLIRRHPHIYGNVQVNGTKDVLENWESIKLNEKKDTKAGLLSGVPDGMPSMIKAIRIQEKAAQVGFDWKITDDIWSKFEEEKLEFKNATNDDERLDEFGDLLFTLVNVGRFEGINADDALEHANRKFKSRIELMENFARVQHKSLKEMSLDQLEGLWLDSKLINKVKS